MQADPPPAAGSHLRFGLIFLSVGRIRYGMDITAILHDCSLDGETGYAATCAEFPEANGQGETQQAAIENLREAIRDIIDYRRDEMRKLLVASDRIEVIAA
jgi:predicted RNase H-like HicB family nuclease